MNIAIIGAGGYIGQDIRPMMLTTRPDLQITECDFKFPVDSRVDRVKYIENVAAQSALLWLGAPARPHRDITRELYLDVSRMSEKGPIVLASTAAVYGVERADPAQEFTDPYSAMKLIQETFATGVVRLGTVIGPSRNGSYFSFVDQQIASALVSGEIVLEGGDRYRCLTPIVAAQRQLIKMTIFIAGKPRLSVDEIISSLSVDAIAWGGTLDEITEVVLASCRRMIGSKVVVRKKSVRRGPYASYSAPLHSQPSVDGLESFVDELVDQHIKLL